jgi:hypothetical protein
MKFLVKSIVLALAMTGAASAAQAADYKSRIIRFG